MPQPRSYANLPEVVVLGSTGGHQLIKELFETFGENIKIKLYDPEKENLSKGYSKEFITTGIIRGEVWNIASINLKDAPDTYRPDIIFSTGDFVGSEKAKIIRQYHPTRISVHNTKDPYEVVSAVAEVTELFPNAKRELENPRLAEGTKLSVVGLGKIGALFAEDALRKYPELAVIGRNRDRERAKEVEKYLRDMGWAHGEDWDFKGVTDFSAIEDSAIVMNTAGVARKSTDMDRGNLLHVNATIVKEVSENIAKYARDSVAINITNPLDEMTYYMLKCTGFERGKVIGMGGVLDTARLTMYTSLITGIDPGNFGCIVIAAHGSGMNPIVCRKSFEGISVGQTLTTKKLEKIYAETLAEGKSQIDLMDGASYAPSAAGRIMASAVLENQERTLPCSVYLDGEWNIKDVCIGVPVVLSKEGIARIREDYPISDKNLSKLQESAVKIKNNLSALFA